MTPREPKVIYKGKVRKDLVVKEYKFPTFGEKKQKTTEKYKVEEDRVMY